MIAVVLALACVVSAQLVDDWNNDSEDQLETVTKTGAVGRNIIFRRTSTRFEKLEQTTETLAKDLLGITLSNSTYITNAKTMQVILWVGNFQKLLSNWLILPNAWKNRCKVWRKQRRKLLI